MTKKCIGCGITLQDKEVNEIGYTPNLDKDLCQRCFKTKNYNQVINITKIMDNDFIIDKVNKEKKHVFFIVDFLNIYQSIIDLYKKINAPKILIITKSDLIPRNIKKSKLIENIKNIYKIEEQIILTSSKTKENINVLSNILSNNQETFFLGFTSSGKSSLINTITNSELTVSTNINTTQEFIKIKNDDYFIIDAPGFYTNNFVDNQIPRVKIKPITYQLKNKYYLKFLDFMISTEEDNSFTFYMSNDIRNEKRKKLNILKNSIKVDNNIDFVIKGLGFINIKKNTLIDFEINDELIEIRPSIIGGYNE